jgi:hypothetical protein
MTVREGGCLCGAVRYRIEALPTDIAYCHCRMCQKASGAPAMAWATVPASAFAWTRGRPTSNYPQVAPAMAAPSLMSMRRDHPRHITVLPGGGSAARAR